VPAGLLGTAILVGVPAAVVKTKNRRARINAAKELVRLKEEQLDILSLLRI